MPRAAGADAVRRGIDHRARIASLVTALLILALAGALGWLSVRFQWQADWTVAGRHSLSEASLMVLEGLQAPLEITAYAREQPDLRDALRRFVDRYRRARPDIVLRFVNPDAVPDETRSLGVSTNGELVLRYQGRIEHVRSINEEHFTNAVQRLLRGRERWLAFAEGHGERSAVGQANHDLGEWARQLKQRGLNFQPLNLGEARVIPDNTAVLVIAGPRTDFLPGELELVLDYLERGGNLLWLMDEPPKGALGLLARHLGIDRPAGTIIDFAGQLLGLSDPTIVLLTASLYGRHAALAGFDFTTVYPTAGALVLSDAGGSWQAHPVLGTGDHTWLETGVLEGEVGMDEGQDLKGPLTIGVVLERAVPGSSTGAVQRAAVIADGDFLSNAYIANTGNLELGLRLINWLSHDDEFIAIPARTAGDRELRMNGTLLGVLGIVFLLVLPLVLLLAGVATWWRRSRM